MSARSLLAELRRRDRVPAATRWLNFGLFAAILCVVPFDGRDRFERAGVERVAACGVGELGTGAGTSPPPPLRPLAQARGWTMPAHSGQRTPRSERPSGEGANRVAALLRFVISSTGRLPLKGHGLPQLSRR